MRSSRARAIGALAAAGLVISLSSAHAAAGVEADDPPIGGAQLGAGLSVNLASGVKALPANLTPKAWLVADLDTGAVLGAYDAHAEHKPASTLKTLAALALIPKIDPSTQITFTSEELELTAQKDGRTTRVGLVPEMAYPAKRLFEAMLALSANDATEALAATAPGGRAATLSSMNAIADTLQARDTHAATPDGLDGPGQQTSAYDLALIARAAIAQPGFLAYDTVPLVKLPSTGRPLSGSNHDRLQNSTTELGGAQVIGGKDGYTTESGQVWWGAAAKNGHRLVVTEMDAGFEPVTQEIQLLNWGFAVDGKIAPVGTLVPPVTAAGTPEKLTDVTASPPAAPPIPPRRPPAAQVTRGSGIWPWILGALILLAAAVLFRRHLRAARPAAGDGVRPAGDGARPTGDGARPTGDGVRPAGDGARPTGDGVRPAGDGGVLGVPPANHPRARGQRPTTELAAGPDDAAPIPAQPAAAGPEIVPLGVPVGSTVKPWEAPVSDRSVILRSSSSLTRDLSPPPAAGRRVDVHLESRVESWRAASTAGASEADTARADRLRSGAVKVIPAANDAADLPRGD